MECKTAIEGGNWQEEMWVEIFDKAIKKRKIVHTSLGQHEFDYALIDPKDGYGRDRISTTGLPYSHIGSIVTFWIKDAQREGVVGLNEGGLAFVLSRMLPMSDFADFVGLHEHVEATVGKTQHREACRIELEEVFKRDQTFVDKYAGWLVDLTRKSKNPKNTYFARAMPDSMEMIKQGRMKPIEILTEFKRQLDLGYHLVT